MWNAKILDFVPQVCREQYRERLMNMIIIGTDIKNNINTEKNNDTTKGVLVEEDGDEELYEEIADLLKSIDDYEITN